MVWDIVLDEQKATDVVFNDRGIDILVDKSLAAFFTIATIDYRNTINGVKFVIK